MPNNSNIDTRLVKLVPRLASDHAGEVAATAAAIGRVLESEGFDWHDLTRWVQGGLQAELRPAVAAEPRARPGPTDRPPWEPKPPQTPWHQAAMEILRVGHKSLSKVENEFLTGLLNWRGVPTGPQRRWLSKLAARFGVEVEHG